MIPSIEAVKQIQRMSGMNFYPKGDDAALKELRLAIECADSVEIAARVVTDILAYQSERPTPKDLREATYEMNQKCAPVPMPTPTPQPTHHCSRCQGHGFFGGYLGGKYAGPWKWCDCFAARQKQRDEPNLVDEANAVREKLLKRFPVNATKVNPLPGLDGDADGYQGEF